MPPACSSQFAIANRPSSGIQLSRPRTDSVLLSSVAPVSLSPIVRPSDPAVLLMTDFRTEPPVAVTEDRGIDDALGDMIRSGIRALLVVRGDVVSGLITSYDIQGERPLQYLRGSTLTRHEEITVGHIMTHWEQVPMLDWAVLERANVSDVVGVLQRSRATHVVVIETSRDGSTLVRGLISKTRAERQLGCYLS